MNVVLRWTAPADSVIGSNGQRLPRVPGRVAAYDVRYSTSAISDTSWLDAVRLENPPVPEDPGTVQEMILPPFDEGTYTFAIRSMDADSAWSDLSNQPTITIASSEDTSPPASIADLTIVEVSADSARLEWTATGDDEHEGRATRYEIRWASFSIDEATWSQATIAPNAPVPAMSGEREAYWLHSLPWNQRFWVAVRAVDDGGNRSGLSNEAFADGSEDRIPPDAVQDLRASLEGPTSVRLDWTAPADSVGTAMEYEIRYSVNPIEEAYWHHADRFLSPPAPGAPGTPQSVTISRLEEATTYFFALKTEDEGGNVSALSNVPTLTIPADMIAPAPITDLRIVDAAGDSALTLWTTTGDDGHSGTAARYDLRSAPSPIDESNWYAATIAPNPPPPSRAGTTDEYRWRSLPPGVRTWLALRSIDESGNESEISNLVIAYPDPDVYPPSRIADLSVAANTYHTATLSWTAPGENYESGQAERYDLRISPTPIDPNDFESYETRPAPEPQASGSLESVILDDLAGAKTFAAIRAIDDAGNAGEVSDVIAIQLPADDQPPSAITDLEAAVLGDSGVELLWTAPEDNQGVDRVARYDVRYLDESLDESNWDRAAKAEEPPAPSAPGTRERMIVGNLPAGTTHWFAVKAVDLADNAADISNIAAITIPENGPFVVQPDGSGTHPNIQAALDSAVPGQIILLGDGVFEGMGNRELEFPPFDVTVRSISGDPVACVIDCGSPESGEIQAVSGNAPIGSGTEIRGIKIRGGRSLSGGAMHIRDCDDLVIRDCLFEGNVSQAIDPGTGVLLIERSTVRLVDCPLIGSFGDMILLDAQSRLEAIRCRFIGVGYGAAIHANGGTVYVEDAEIRLGCNENCSAIVCSGCELEAHGMSIEDVVQGAALVVSNGADARIFDSSVSETWLKGLPLIYSNQSRLHLERCTLDRVFGSGSSDALRVSNSHVALVGCELRTIQGVQPASFRDCDVLIESTSTRRLQPPEEDGPETIFSFDGACDVVVRESTLCGSLLSNRVGSGRAPILAINQGSLTIENSILFGNENGEAISAGNVTVEIRCTDIFGNSYRQVGEPDPIDGNWIGPIAEQLGQNGNIEADPLFCDPDAHDYRLQPASPCAPFSEPNPECDRIGAFDVGCAP